MEKYVEQNKLAWEYNTYNFWAEHHTPKEFARELLENPRRALKQFNKYLDDVDGLSIAVICGSCGKKAVPLAILGAEVTVFDLSAENARYATETAKAAGIDLDYVVGDVLNIDMWVFGGSFDIVFMEGGILHYFHDIKRFMNVMYALLKDGGRMICSDFHPIHKIIDVLELRGQKGWPADLSEADYFSTAVEECEMPHARYYDDEKRGAYPKCLLRRYTLSEIINAAVGAGFAITGFDEQPAWTNVNLPGEFTLLAEKYESWSTNMRY